MKRILLIVALVCAFAFSAMAAESPIDKGSMILGGNVYFMTQGGDLYKNANDDSRTTLSATPQIGYFIAPSIMIGGMFEYTKFSWGDNNGNTTFGIGPMVGYYFNMNPTEIKGAIYPYIQGFFLYQTVKQEGADDKGKTTSFGGRGGIDYMLSDAVALDIGVQFQSDSYKFGDGESTSGTIIMVGAGITAFVF